MQSAPTIGPAVPPVSPVQPTITPASSATTSAMAMRTELVPPLFMFPPTDQKYCLNNLREAVTNVHPN